MHADSSGNDVLEEILNKNGAVLTREHLLLGTRERLREDGALDSLEAIFPSLVLKNIDAVCRQQGGHDAIFRMVASRGEAWLSDYKKYQHHPDAQQILEAAIVAMPLEMVQQHRLSLEASLSELLTKEPNEATANENKEAQVLLDLFRFREKMLEDGLVIARQSDATNNLPTLASQVWNDPRSRNYFSIENDWIDWSSARVQGLMGGQDTPLARADLKLLVSRALYARNSEPSKQTTQE